MIVSGKKMGLFGATVLVTVNMIGTGIFLLPVSMASVGSISILGWIVASLGAAAIGIMFATLGSVDPQPGGPYAYARQSFGPYLGFQTNYGYWSANLVGNIAVATTVTGYFIELIPALKPAPIATTFSIGVIWTATAINIIGPRLVEKITGWSTIFAMIPLLLVAVAGWIWFDPALFVAGWNPTNEPALKAVSSSAAYALWAFMGVESASVSSGVIENPKRNVPLATILGLLIAMVLYVTTCVVLMGIIPMEELKNSTAPFAVAAAKALGPAAGAVMAVAAILKAGSSLIGWTLTISQSARAAAEDGMFPKLYRATNANGIPVWNLFCSAILMTVIVIATASASLTEQFNEIIDMAVILTLLPYLYTSVRYLAIPRTDASPETNRRFVVAVATVACAYCLWALAGSAANLTQTAMIFLCLSIPLYAIFARGMAQSPQP